MARKQRRYSRSRKTKKSSLFGAFVIEGFAAVIFIALFVQARAERQADPQVETRTPIMAEVFEQTPLHNWAIRN